MGKRLINQVVSIPSVSFPRGSTENSSSTPMFAYPCSIVPLPVAKVFYS